MAVSISDGASIGGSGFDYYSQSQGGDYYNQHEQSAGFWAGKGLEFVGLKNGQVVDKTAMDNLSKGFRPQTEEALVYNAGRENHRSSYDIAYSPDKSVSIMREFMPEFKEIIDKAVESATLENVKNIEATQLQIRETVGSETVRTQTDNAMIAVFKHETTRGDNPDMDLHYHAVFMNLTHLPEKDRYGNEFKAIENNKIYKNQTLNSRAFTNELAKNLVEAGIAIENTKNGFRIQGVTDEMIALFSKRSQEMRKTYDDLKKKYGDTKSDAELKEMAALATRPEKNLNKVSSESNIESWKSQAKAAGFDILESIKTVQEEERKKGGSGGDLVKGGNKMNAGEALSAAFLDLTQREAVLSKNELFSKALEYSVGYARLSDIEHAALRLKESGQLIEKAGNFTSKEIIEAQKYIERTEKAGVGAVSSIAQSDEQIQNAINQHEAKSDFSFHSEQIAGINNILKSVDRYQNVQGVAGAGKTDMLDIINKVAKANGFNVVAISFQGNAANEMAQSINSEAHTIESFKSITLKQNDVVINDEASMTSLRDMKAIVEKVEAAGARLINVGDKNQILSIGAGKIFEESQKFGLTQTELKISIRQRDPFYRSVVQDLNDKKFDKAFNKMDKAGKIVEAQSEHVRRQETLKAYNDMKLKIKDTGIVTILRKDRDFYNKEIRNAEIKNGNIKNLNTFTIKENLNLSPTQLRNAANYKARDLIFLKKGVEGIGKAGAEFRITEIDAQNNTLKVENVKSVSYALPSAFSSHTSSMQDHTVAKETVVGKNSTLIHSSSMSDVVQHGNYMNVSGISVVKTTVELNLKDKNLTDKIGGVFRESQREFGTNEEIRITKNDNKYAVKNGQTGVITSIKNDLVTVKFKDKTKTLNMKEFNHIDYAYASTVNGFQGGKRDGIIADIVSKHATKNNTYVAVTRGVNDFRVITDNKEALRENAKETQIKTSVSDMRSRSDVRAVRQVVRQTEQKRGGGQAQAVRTNSVTPSGPGGR